MKTKLKKLHKDAIIPTYGTEDSACVDLYAVEDVSLKVGELKFLRTGWSMEIPSGYYIELFNRGSMSAKHQLVIISSRVCDADYRGEYYIPLKNIGNSDKVIRKGDRIAQMMIKKVIKMEFEEVEELSETERGAGAFGHTGQ